MQAASKNCDTFDSEPISATIRPQKSRSIYNIEFDILMNSAFKNLRSNQINPENSAKN